MKDHDLADRLAAKVAPYTRTSPHELRAAIADQLARTPRLADCSPQSLETAILRALYLGLDLNPAAEEAHLSPRKNRAILIPGYRGLLKLAYKNPRVAMIEAHCVYASDAFSLTYGHPAPITHTINPTRSPDDPWIGAYAILWWSDHDRPMVEYMTKAEIDAAADRGGDRTADRRPDSPWVTDWPQMARKTVLKRLLNYLARHDDADQDQPDAEPPTPARTDGETRDTTDLAATYADAIADADLAALDAIHAAIRADDRLDATTKGQLLGMIITKKRTLRQGA